MKEIIGKYNTAKIFTDVVDGKSIEQVKQLCDQEFVTGSKIRMMPDIHAGAGCTIGTTMTITDKVCPNLVGVDIGCGMHVTKLDVKEVDFEKLDKVIREYIPSGFDIRDNVHQYTKNIRINELKCRQSMNIDRAYRSIGSLGGGNHFIEIDRDEATGDLYLVIHSGSRHLGVEVANCYQNWAYDLLKAGYETNRQIIIDTLCTEGRQYDISKELVKLGSFNIPKNLCYVSGILFYSYLHDMEIVQDYAKWNRIAMTDIIRGVMGWGSEEDFHTIHNYIDTENMILRKGAVSAQSGEKLFIPINMRDGGLICVGKGNPDWNFSAPHGAGRLFGRMEAKRRFGLNDFEKSMKGIYTTSVGVDTLDECPMAYKSMDDITNNITDTVDVIKVIKPVYNFKASE